MAEYDWGEMIGITYTPSNKPAMGAIFWVGGPIQIFPGIRRKTAMDYLITGS